jgi:hypothetical protein
MSNIKQLANQWVSVLDASTSVMALHVVTVDSTGGIVSPGAGSTQVSIREMLTSSGASMLDSTNTALRVNVVAGSAAGSTQVSIKEILSSSGGTLVDSTTVALKVSIVAGAAGSTQVSIKEILSSSGGTLVDSTNVALKVAIVAGSVSGSTQAVELANIITAATANPTVIRASAGQLRSVHVYNNAGYPVYVKFHNSTAAPTAGAGVVMTVGAQAGTQRDWVFPAQGLTFSTGIGLTCVKDMASTGTTATALNDAAIGVSYSS